MCVEHMCEGCDTCMGHAHVVGSYTCMWNATYMWDFVQYLGA